MANGFPSRTPDGALVKGSNFGGFLVLDPETGEILRDPPGNAKGGLPFRCSTKPRDINRMPWVCLAFHINVGLQQGMKLLRLMSSRFCG